MGSRCASACEIAVEAGASTGWKVPEVDRI